MSIRDEINRHIGRKLFHLPPLVPSDPLIRELFVSTEVLEIASEPFAEHRDGFRHAQFRGYLDAFTSGEEIGVSEKPFNKRYDTFLARVHPRGLEVWDVRAIEPRPGIRCFGCFGDRDLFIALTYEYRENLVETEDGFAAEAQRCRKDWDSLFSSEPHRGSVSDLLTNFYIS
jgi:hypothetical protein